MSVDYKPRISVEDFIARLEENRGESVKKRRPQASIPWNDVLVELTARYLVESVKFHNFRFRSGGLEEPVFGGLCVFSEGHLLEYSLAEGTHEIHCYNPKENFPKPTGMTSDTFLLKLLRDIKA